VIAYVITVIIFTSTPVCVVISLYVHLSALISKTTCLHFTTIFYGHGSVLLWWQCNMSYTSVLLATSCFHIMGHMGRINQMTLCLVELAVGGHNIRTSGQIVLSPTALLLLRYW